MKQRNIEEVEKILTDIFPSYVEQLKEDKKEQEWEYSIHSLFLDFIHYFSSNIEEFNSKQLKKMANFINEAVEIDDNLENAISTCFLEHLYQVNSLKQIKPMLSKLAKEKLHA